MEKERRQKIERTTNKNENKTFLFSEKNLTLYLTSAVRQNKKTKNYKKKMRKTNKKKFQRCKSRLFLEVFTDVHREQ